MELINSNCPGCNGKKIIPIKFQRIIRGKRICVIQDETCHVCNGTGIATDKEVEEWLIRVFPETKREENENV